MTQQEEQDIIKQAWEERETYPKHKILFYFNQIDTMIQGSWYTSMFDDSLLPYVDDLCALYKSGKWKPHPMATGFPNWYFEFKDYLISIGVKIIWK